jgi:streptogrisin D
MVLFAGTAAVPHGGSAIAVTALRDSLIMLAPQGSAAYVDQAAGQVLLRLAGPAPAALVAAVARHPGRVRTQISVAVEPAMALYGGHGMTPESGSVNCTTGFNAVYGASNYVITAGHCLKSSRYWDRMNEYLGERASWVFGPEGDYGLLLVKGVHMSPFGRINLPGGPRDVAGTIEPYWGQYMCFMGNVSKLRCGAITAFDVTVPYDDVTFPVQGLIETTICVQGGDSGGPLFAPPEAAGGLLGAGILSGHTRPKPCSDPEYRSYFQPLQPILSMYSLILRTW